MRHGGAGAWRWCFVIGGLLYLAGSLQHPRGAMVDMLADPSWVRGHAMILVSLLVLCAGLALFRRRELSPALRRWTAFALVATALEAVEMAVHTVSYVDAGALAAGQSTPVLTVHLWLATLIYPVFGIAMLGLVWVGQLERSLGSPWIAWLGILGAVAHGVVMWLVFVFEIGAAGLLFPIAAFSVSLWFILAGVWPTRQSHAAWKPTSELPAH